MNISSYVFVLILGMLGFGATSLILINKSKESITIDAKVYVLDSASATYDVLRIKSNELGFKRNSLDSLKVAPEIVKDQSITYSQLIFNLNPNYLIWIMLISIGIAVGLASIPISSFLLMDISSKDTRKQVVISFIASLVSLFMVFVMAQFAGKEKLLIIPRTIDLTGIMFDRPEVVLGVVTGLIMLPNIVCVAGNFYIFSRIKKVANVDEQIKLHRRFTQFLTITSILLVFGVLTPSYLRLTVLGFFPEGYDYLFPKQFVFAYSMVFTFALIILFLPVELAFRFRFNELRESSTMKQKSQIDSVLSQTSVFKMGLSLLAPVIANMFLDGISAVI